ncbi:MAG: M48 family metalloprotease [Candidatus Roizmanbacteria bacterium]
MNYFFQFIFDQLLFLSVSFSIFLILLLYILLFSYYLIYIQKVWKLIRIFRKYEPLDPILKDSLLRIAKKSNVPMHDIYSFTSHSLNAFASGYGKKSAISFTSRTLEESTPAEINGVFAHELGHIYYGHTKKMTLVFIFQTIAIIGIEILFANISSFIIFPEISFIVENTIIFIIIQSAFSSFRKNEILADEFAHKILPDTSGLISFLTKAYDERNNHHWYVRFVLDTFHMHPSLEERKKLLQNL